MADITQLSDDDLLALSRQQQLAAIPDDQLKAMAPKPPVTAADRVQASEGGLLKGSAYFATAIPDAAANLWNLAGAGMGTAVGLANTRKTTLPDRTAGGLYHFIAPDGSEHFSKNPPPVGSKPVTQTSTSIPDSLQVNSGPSPVGAALTGFMDRSPLTTTQPNRPDDAISRYLSTGFSVLPSAVAGGGGLPTVLRTTATAVPPALAGQAVSEAKPFGDNDSLNNTVSVLTQALGTAAMPRPRVVTPGNEVSNQTVRDAQAQGLKIPPATTNNSIKNRLIESIAGKRNVEQRAAVMNTEGANQAGRNDLQIGGTGQITEAEIAGVRAAAKPAYTAMRQAGPIQTGSDPAFVQTLTDAQQKYTGAGRVLSNSGSQGLEKDITDILSKPTHDAGDLLDTVSVLRDRATTAFRNGENGMGAAYRQVSDAIEKQIDTSLTRANGGVPTPTVQNFRDARQRLAIAHTIEDARDEGSGNINGQRLAGMLSNGVPISGQLATVARAAQVAKAAFAPTTHSAGVNHLGLWGTILGGLALGHEAHPGAMGAALGAIPGGLALGREGAARYALGPGQGNAIPTQRAPLDPRALASALMSAQARTQ